MERALRMIQFFTDFGWHGPYVGQMRAAVYTHGHANGIPVVDLMHDAPKHDPRAASYLLAALVDAMPPETVCAGVVDPGVGTERDAVILRAGGRYFVGPDNGLFEIPARRHRDAAWHRITWRPEKLSASFHGRDLFTPVAARIAAALRDKAPEPDWLSSLAEECSPPAFGASWPDELDEVIYVDDFGNCVLGRRSAAATPGSVIRIGQLELPFARTFGAVPEGGAFWYENSMGLMEIAVNKGSAADRLALGIGTPVTIA